MKDQKTIHEKWEEDEITILPPKKKITKRLFIYDLDGNVKHSFPVSSTTYAVNDGKLYVTNRGCQFRFPLNCYTYDVKEM